MGDIVDINEQAKAAATEASKPGKFSFLDRLAGRNYPKDEVVVYLDEEAGYNIQDIEDELDVKRKSVKLFEKDETLLANVKAEISKLEEQLEANREKAAQSRFVFHLEGIPTETYDAAIDYSQEQYPLEYREARNPVTFALERSVIENEERDQLFRTHLWAAFIRRVVDPEGNVDDNITPDWVAQLLNLLPVIGQIRIGMGVEKLRMTTDWMDKLQGEDFFPKS